MCGAGADEGEHHDDHRRQHPHRVQRPAELVAGANGERGVVLVHAHRELRAGGLNFAVSLVLGVAAAWAGRQLGSAL